MIPAGYLIFNKGFTGNLRGVQFVSGCGFIPMARTIPVRIGQFYGMSKASQESRGYQVAGPDPQNNTDYTVRESDPQVALVQKLISIDNCQAEYFENESALRSRITALSGLPADDIINQWIAYNVV